MAKPEKEKDDPHRQITPVVTGDVAEMCAWLEELFNLTPHDTEPGKPKTQPDSMPERIVLRAVVKRNAIGPEIKAKEWKPMSSPLPTREALVMLANMFYGHAKKDAAALGRHQRYGLFAYSNLKGPEDYERHYFFVDQGAKEYGKGEIIPASDDDDTHRDRLLARTLADARWHTETFMEAHGNVLRAVMENNRSLQEQLAHKEMQLMQREVERRQMIVANEEMLSKKQEREIAAESAKMKNTIIQESILAVKSLLPAFQIYLSKGKIGIVEGLRDFVEGLSADVKESLFGKWSNGERETAGILDEHQVRGFFSVLDGSTPASAIVGFMQSLRPEQVGAAQSMLSPAQFQTLLGIAKSVEATSNGANG
jgi:hypothetical protein